MDETRNVEQLISGCVINDFRLYIAFEQHKMISALLNVF